MANEDTLRDQGDIAAAVTYDPSNIPRGYGYRPQSLPVAQGGVAPAPVPQQSSTKGNTRIQVVTQSAKIILPADPNRKFLLIQNADPAGNIWVAFGIDASVNIGIKIPSGGGGLLLDNNVPTCAISAIGDVAANPFVTIVEA